MLQRYVSSRWLLLALLAAAPAAFAQTGVTIGAATAPDVSAALDIVSSSKGALLPRVADATAIATPATGLLVFQTGAPAGFYYNAGTPAAPSWQQIATAAGAADNLGNHTATQPLKLNGNALSDNGTGGIRIDAAGQVGINAATPGATLDVGGAGSTLRVAGLSGTGPGRLVTLADDGTLQPQASALSGPGNTLPQPPVAVGGPVTTGVNPQQVVVNAAGTRAYIVSSGSNTLQVYDITNPTAAPVAVGSPAPTDTYPEAVALNPAGTRAYVFNEFSSTFQTFDISNPNATPVVISSIATTGGGPFSVVMNAAGTRLYVSNMNSNTLQVYNISGATPVAVGSPVATDNHPVQVVMNPAGTRAYVVCTAATLQAYDISNTNAAPTPVGSSVATGAFPNGLGINTAGTRVYVLNGFGANSLQAFDVSNPAVAPVAIGSAVPTGTNPIRIAVNAADTRAYVVNYSSSTLQTFDISNPAVAPVAAGSPIATGSFPRSIALNPANTRAYVVGFNDNTLHTYAITARTQALVVGADGSISTVPVASLGDNLGNHTATQTLNLNNNALSGGSGNNVKIGGSQTLELGAGVSGKDASAGKIGYQAFTSGALDIVGAGTSATNRRIKLWSEGGAEFAGNVGIGISTPTQALDMSGTARLRGLTAAGLVTTSNLGVLSSAAPANGLSMNGGAVGLGGTLSAATTIAQAGNFFSLTGGRVGIGTSIPTQALEVAGQVFSSTGGFRFPDNTIQTTAVVAAPATTASNGLTKTGNDVALGGTLTGATTVANGGFALNVTGTGSTSFGGSVGIGTTAPAASAVLDVTSITKGLLPPRMSETQRNAIAGPATGLTLYNTTTNRVNVWNGTSWDATLTATEQPVQYPTQTFGFTGGPQTYTVPAGVTRLRVDARAGAGGGATFPGNNLGGAGARVQATLSVSPGQVLQVQVGGGGPFGSSGAFINGGYNGGGGAYAGGAGGGATDVRSSGGTLADRLLVAAGGGGGGYYSPTQGGAGGAPTGGNGSIGTGGSPATGATQTSGGSTGGSLGSGGSGSGGSNSNGGGGGGGGYYGGGGGSSFGAGGGGSSWVTPTGSSLITMTAGANAGDGILTLTPELVYAAPVLDASNFINVPGDNLGNHTATRNLNLGTNALVGTTAVNVGSNLNLGANALVGNGGTAGLTVSNGGNVGIGTSAPNTHLSITPNVVEPKITLWDGGVANAASHYGFGISSGQLNYHISSAGDNHVFFAGGRNGDGTELMRIQGNGTVSTGGEVRVQNPNNRLRRTNTPQQAVADVFDPTGLNGVHISNNEGEEGGFWANGNYAAIYSPGDNDLVKFIDEDGFDNAGTVFDGVALKARIDGFGQYFQVSDAQAKHDITPIVDGLRKLTALNGYTYTFNLLPKEKEKGQTAQRAAGVLAQEVEKVLPEAVSQQDGHYMVNYAALTPLFIQAIKELKAENDALKARAAAAEAQAAILETAATQAAADHASLLTLQAQVARLLGEQPTAAQAAARK